MKMEKYLMLAAMAEVSALQLRTGKAIEKLKQHQQSLAGIDIRGNK